MMALHALQIVQSLVALMTCGVMEDLMTMGAQCQLRVRQVRVLRGIPECHAQDIVRKIAEPMRCGAMEDLTGWDAQIQAIAYQLMRLWETMVLRAQLFAPLLVALMKCIVMGDGIHGMRMAA